MTTERKLAVAGVALLLLLTAIYANRFYNDFAFDNSHTINSNAYIRDVGITPVFFTDSPLMYA